MDTLRVNQKVESAQGNQVPSAAVEQRMNQKGEKQEAPKEVPAVPDRSAGRV